jgi:hypothetical protein
MINIYYNIYLITINIYFLLIYYIMVFFDYLYKLIKLCGFLIFSYFILAYIPQTSITTYDLIKMMILFTVLFIMVDSYYPTISYQ